MMAHREVVAGTLEWAGDNALLPNPRLQLSRRRPPLVETMTLRPPPRS